MAYEAVGFVNYLQLEPATASDTSTMLQPCLLDNCELGRSSCDSSIMLSVCRPCCKLPHLCYRANLPNQHLWTSRQSTPHAGTSQPTAPASEHMRHSAPASEHILSTPCRNAHMPKDSSSISAQQCPRISTPAGTPTDTVTHAQTAPASCRHTHMLKQASEHQCPQHTSMPKQLQQSTAMYLTPHAGVVDIPHDYTLPINCVSCEPVSAMCFCHVLHLV